MSLWLQMHTIKEMFLFGRNVYIGILGRIFLRLPMPQTWSKDAQNAPSEAYFTETLARIYIKQGKYDKAIEIIRRLSLNYPKKSRYFADQIRFLGKLILNERSKNEEK